MAFNCYVIYMHCCNAIQLQSAGNAANKRDEIETANGHANRDECNSARSSGTSSTHVLSYARRHSHIHENDYDHSSKRRIIRLRFVHPSCSFSSTSATICVSMLLHSQKSHSNVS
ncbi:GD22154 [Drosophila simulans]|uniref:GD22154 n=1 Tax=Drosophila simulans TaxID=7240 RepID=B4Q399_DROSI|nr:GD22154 [Drosophila simulans]